MAKLTALQNPLGLRPARHARALTPSQRLKFTAGVREHFPSNRVKFRGVVGKQQANSQLGLGQFGSPASVGQRD